MVGCDQLETGHPSLEALTNQYAEMSESKQELLIDNSKFVIRNKCLQLVVLYGSLTFCVWLVFWVYWPVHEEIPQSVVSRHIIMEQGYHSPLTYMSTG